VIFFLRMAMLQKNYSLRPILLFANTDVFITKICLDTTILAKSIMGRREYSKNLETRTKILYRMFYRVNTSRSFHVQRSGLAVFIHS
jgi:hypothetical protein